MREKGQGRDDSTREPGRPKRRSLPILPIWKKLLFAAAAFVLFFAGIELILFLAGVQPVLYRDDPYVGFASYVPLYVETSSPDGEVTFSTAPNKIRFFNPQSFARNKARGAYRIFCVGGSTTYGRPYNGKTSFCGWLREFLHAAHPGRGWEVVNAGGISYASYRVAALMEEIAQYEPDLVIIYSAHNEFLENRTYRAMLSVPKVVRGFASSLQRLRLYSLVHQVIAGGFDESADPSGREFLPDEVETRLNRSVGPTDYARDDALREKILAHYKYNLGRMIDIAHAAGAEVFLVGPAANLKDCSPFKSEHRDGLGEADLERWNTFFEQGQELLQRDLPQVALSRLDQAVRLDDRYAHGHYTRGLALLRLGRRAEAKAAFIRARDEDVCPLRAVSEIETTVREMATARDVAYVDFAALVEPHSLHRIPGAETFLDHVHPTIEGHRILALALLDEMVRRGVARPAASWNESAVASVVDRVEGTLDRRAHATALKNLAKVFGWAGKFEEARKLGLRATEALADDAEAHFNLGVALEQSGDNERARVAYRRALELEPTYVDAHVKLGRVAEKSGDFEAAARSYREALRLRPESGAARAHLGNVLSRLGKPEEAVAHLRQVLSAEPDNAEAHAKLGVILLRQRKLERAEYYLRAAVRLAPQNPRPLNNLGVTLAEQSRFRDAAHYYERALRLDPNYASAHNNLGNLRAAEGKLGEAIVRFTRVLQIAPGNAEAAEKLKVMEERFRKVLNAKPDEAEARLYLGMVLAARGAVDAARGEYERALEAARASGTRELEARIMEQVEKVGRQ